MRKISTSFKKFAFIFLYKIYKLFENHPKIINFLLKLNNKIGLVKNYKKVLSIALENSNSKKNTNKNLGKIQNIKDIKVALIADEFTYESLKYEFNAIPVEPSDWKEIFTKEMPDIFFCESAWSGIDSIVRPWKGRIYSSINFDYENRTHLLEILNYCKKKGIPTIFWNKEDPAHFYDKIHNFVDTALKFDYIFTTSIECVGEYKKLYKHPNVYPLMFAAQPKIFNPIEKYSRTDDVVFAGSWYKQHVQRSKEMEEILDKIISSGFNLKIYDRYYGNSDENHFFPDKYKKFIYPNVSYKELADLYKSSKYALNINTVCDSQSMFARRVFELMSSYTYVLSNYSLGMEYFFGDNVTFIKDNINIKDESRAKEENLYLILKHHTYENRFKQILNTINFNYNDNTPFFNIYYIIDDISKIDKFIETTQSINYKKSKFILLLSDNIENSLIKNLYQNYNKNDVEVISLDYVKKYGFIESPEDYFVILKDYENVDFLNNALLHYSYIDKKTGIFEGIDKFTFIKDSGCYNTVFESEFFEDIIHRILTNSSDVLYEKYMI